MDTKQLAEYVDQQRWLLNNGLISNDVKNQLFFCGSIIHRDVRAVEVDIHPEKRTISYKLYFDKSLIQKINRYSQLSKSQSLFGMWRFKRLIKKEGVLDFHAILNRFVRDFCGPKWSATIEIVDNSTFVEELGVEGEDQGTGQQLNQLLDA